MKNTYLLFSALYLIGLFACTPSHPAQQPAVPEAPKVGSDRDAHGCIGSAGYTWSEIRQECVRLFEKGIRLNPVEKGTAEISAFIILSGDESRAELFLPNNQPSMILNRQGDQKNATWQQGDFKLLKEKGYVLQKNGKTMYTAQ